MASWSVGNSISFDNVVALRAQGEQYIDREQRLIFDFSQVQKSDSSALSLMLCWRRYAHVQSKSVVFDQLPASLETLATLCDVASILGISQKDG